jgi:DNA polymerase III subunit gamma/tau
MTDRVLSISLRPQKLDDVVGQDDIVKTVKTQFESGRVPHFFLIVGPTGSGKTTLARIIALMLQHKDPLKDKIDYSISKYDIKEINASDKNGVDDIRELLETIKYRPLQPSLAKVIIMDEAHQLTTAAQNALLKDTEDASEHLYFIFCTNNDSKILPTLKRRAYILNTHGIDKEATGKLLLTAKKKIGFKGDLAELKEALEEYEVDSPGLILQATEKYFSGMSAIDSVFGSGSEGSVDTKKLCNLVLKGNWKDASVILKSLKKEDIVMTRLCILGYFKTVLLNSGSVKIAQAMKIISEDVYDLPTFLANLCIACNTISPKA